MKKKWQACESEQKRRGFIVSGRLLVINISYTGLVLTSPKLSDLSNQKLD